MKTKQPQPEEPEKEVCPDTAYECSAPTTTASTGEGSTMTIKRDHNWKAEDPGILERLDGIESQLAEILMLMARKEADEIGESVQTEKVYLDPKEWTNLLEGCSYGDGWIEADYMQALKVWRVKYTVDDFTFPVYLPQFVAGTFVHSWWEENNATFLSDMLLAKEANDQI